MLQIWAKCFHEVLHSLGSTDHGCLWHGAGTSEQVDYSSISEAEWRRRLTKEQFNVARKKGTERAFTGCVS